MAATADVEWALGAIDKNRLHDYAISVHAVACVWSGPGPQ